MKKIKVLIFIILCLNSFSYSQSQGNYFIKRGVKAETLLNTPFPDFFISDESSFITNNKLAGKIVYINFWFAACRPCMEEMPIINRLYERFKKDTNFVFISLTYNEEDVIQKVKSKFAIKYRVYTIPHREIFRLNRTQSYPAHVIIDKNGMINSYFTGGFNAKFLEKVIYPSVYKLLNVE